MDRGRCSEPPRSLSPKEDPPYPRGNALSQERFSFGEPSEGAQESEFFRYLPRFLDPRDARELMARLLQEEPFASQEIVLFGKRVREPRLISWAGEVPYTYSGKTLPPRPLSATLGGLLERLNREIEELQAAPANHILLNYYRDGTDSMGLHADDEPELGKDPVIVSLSLGAERPFRFVEREGKRSFKLTLASGSVLVMRAGTQEHWKHELPKVRGALEPRLNLTLRRILHP